ncbi:PREDICTED: myb-like protein V [Papilio xuthus]|uniref:Myb-like protein V n=1 Tax=Papilio xuthus TaxID=66420 RepID=A0AAJ6ZJM4_PAPXU|nr:PREDICTED: myb-like protein V [Papilio xuthus]
MYLENRIEQLNCCIYVDKITVAVVSPNESQNITLYNATEIKSNDNTTTDQINNIVSNLTIKEQIIEVPQKDNHNITEKSAGNDTQTALKEQSTIESEYKQNHNNDTLLKYIYKKNEKENLPQKSKGHVQNSLKRRKRFINSSDSDIVPKPKILLVPIDYLDIDQGKSKEELFLPVTQTGAIVQSSNLADFNIETIHHDDAKPANDAEIKENNHPKVAIDSKFYPSPQNDETKEESQKSVENKYRLKNEAKTKDSGENRSGSEESSSSFESEHSVETPNASTSSEYNKESKETENYRDSANPTPRKRNRSDENQETDKSYDSSIENNSEASQEYTGKSIELYSDQGNNSSSKNKPLIVPKQDYINLEINKGDVEELPNTSREKYTKDTTDSLETPKASEEVSNESKSDESKEVYTDSRSQEELKDNKSEKQTLINDEEIKPVVELNNGSVESSEEISEEDVNSRLKNNSKLVSLTPVKNIHTKSKEFSAQSDDLEKKGNVKQQFERIPLDYIHADEVNKNNTSNITASHIKPIELSSEEKDKEGTLDTLSPINPTYDDELNIKFHDLPLKLPEIKLPEDILSYAYDGPYYETKKSNDKEAQKQKFYHNYEDDDLDVNPKDKYNKEDDFYDYYKNNKEYDHVKRNSKIKNEEGENEDLYEKFVRERFGKKPVKQRFERIQDERIPSQLKLRKTLKNILKKTENVKKEAEKSGDPNANYMWTLEYGENL